jgi:nucleoside-diphosphate-sugar epimerase
MVLVTGGAGFFGGVLKKTLLDRGFKVVSIDMHPDPDKHPNLISVWADLRDAKQVEWVFTVHQPEAVFHCAAVLAHDAKNEDFLWTSNVDATRILAEAAARRGTKKIVYISTNCLWGRSFDRPVTESDEPAPIETYGRSKLEAEKILQGFQKKLDVVTLRTPTIIDAGRLGLLAILFEFIDEGRKVWVVGDGGNRYQFVYAADLAEACLLSLEFQNGSDVFNVGSENVKTLREVYETVIKKAGSKSRVASLPKAPSIAAMRLAYSLGASPLGPYHYRMIAEDFAFDISKAKRDLGWKPTLTNEEMLLRAYEFYHSHRKEIEARGSDVAAHKRPAKMGVIRLLKWLS